MRVTDRTPKIPLAAITGFLLAALLPFTAGAVLPPPRPDVGNFTFGIEGFYDRYREPIAPNILVDEHSHYGSVTAGYTYNIQSNFITLEGRGSYGKDNYKSPSGTIADIPQYETDTRLLGGVNIPFVGGHFIIPYIGIGDRWFFDQNKGNVTSLGLSGYDRRINQIYVPLGLAMQIKDKEWFFMPKFEVDLLVHGDVKSRLGEIPGLFHVDNSQTKGVGVRTELYAGQKYESFSWEAGPFVRYWDVPESKPTTDPNGTTWIEPHNTRLQLGLGARVHF